MPPFVIFVTLVSQHGGLLNHRFRVRSTAIKIQGSQKATHTEPNMGASDSDRSIVAIRQ